MGHYRGQPVLNNRYSPKKLNMSTGWNDIEVSILKLFMVETSKSVVINNVFLQRM